jgi:hypothetical protein
MTFYVVTTKERRVVDADSESGLRYLANWMGWNVISWVRVR